jgi:DNA-binding SARP family transcriptional activator
LSGRPFVAAQSLGAAGVPANSVLRADRFSVGLNPDAVSTDVDAFEAAIKESAKAASTTERLHRLADAVRRYTGVLLPDSFENGCWANASVCPIGSSRRPAA